MSTHRLDALARAVADGGSRRGLLRSLAAGAALLLVGRLSPARAHHASLGPGDPCRTDSECLSVDAPLICADNGFAFDGPLNCCTYEGSRCGSDQECCWGNACADGVCASIGNFPGPGERCNSLSHCVAADVSLTCDYVGQTNDFRCCADERDRCSWDGACCGWLRCNDHGLCTGSPPTGCDGVGCECDFRDPNACADGLVCCAVQSGFICATSANCGG